MFIRIACTLSEISERENSTDVMLVFWAVVIMNNSHVEIFVSVRAIESSAPVSESLSGQRPSLFIVHVSYWFFVRTHARTHVWRALPAPTSPPRRPWLARRAAPDRSAADTVVFVIFVSRCHSQSQLRLFSMSVNLISGSLTRRTFPC